MMMMRMMRFGHDIAFPLFGLLVPDSWPMPVSTTNAYMHLGASSFYISCKIVHFIYCRHRCLNMSSIQKYFVYWYLDVHPRYPS